MKTRIMNKLYKCASCSNEFPSKELEKHVAEFHFWN